MQAITGTGEVQDKNTRYKLYFFVPFSFVLPSEVSIHQHCRLTVMSIAMLFLTLTFLLLIPSTISHAFVHFISDARSHLLTRNKRSNLHYTSEMSPASSLLPSLHRMVHCKSNNWMMNSDNNYDQEEMQSFLEDIEEYNIDSFLRGDYDRPFTEDAPAPHPGIVKPSEMLEAALKALRALDEPELNHGAAVFLRFCVPLSRNERWGGGRSLSTSTTLSSSLSEWKEILRGALTPNMFARRIESSPVFSILLHWQRMSVVPVPTASTQRKNTTKFEFGTSSALVHVQFFIHEDDDIHAQKAIMIQFDIQKYNGVWMIADALAVES
jgi:hypothetical protein